MPCFLPNLRQNNSDGHTTYQPLRLDMLSYDLEVS
jgi:hypothetical protein